MVQRIKTSDYTPSFKSDIKTEPKKKNVRAKTKGSMVELQKIKSALHVKEYNQNSDVNFLTESINLDTGFMGNQRPRTEKLNKRAGCATAKESLVSQTPEVSVSGMKSQNTKPRKTIMPFR